MKASAQELDSILNSSFPTHIFESENVFLWLLLSFLAFWSSLDGVKIRPQWNLY